MPGRETLPCRDRSQNLELRCFRFFTQAAQRNARALSVERTCIVPIAADWLQFGEDDILISPAARRSPF
jgi:hypothetical protein